MKQAKYILLIWTIFLSACNIEESPNGKIKITDETKTISMNPELNTELKYSWFIDSIEYITLNAPENVLISANISKIICVKDRYCILDENKVFVFDLMGNYLFDIGKIGKGPGELNYPNDFFVDTIDNTIEIYSAGNQKVSKFKLTDGKFIDEFHVHYQVANICKLENGDYLFHGILLDEYSRDILNNLIFANPDGDILKTAISYPDYISKFRGKSRNSFSQLKDGTLYSRMLDNNFYLIKDNKIEIKYRIDYGKSNLKVSKELADKYNYLGDIMDNTDYAVQFSGHWCNDSYLCFHYYLYHKRIQTIYNIKYNQVLYGDKVKNDIDFGPISYFSGIQNNALIGIIEPYRFISHFNKTVEDKEIWEEYKKAQPAVYNVYSSIKEDDNPIIMVCYLKEKFQLD